MPLIHSTSELDPVQIPTSVIEETDIHRREEFYKITRSEGEPGQDPGMQGSRPELSLFT